MNTKEQAKKARNLMRNLAVAIAVTIAIIATFIWVSSSDKRTQNSDQVTLEQSK